MGYSNNYNSGEMEPNSVSLAMFASVGFHAVLFVLMAFFPAASETVKKPLRIVNLLPPSQGNTSLQPQAKTSTLEDILQNPLPDLSAGFPPVGNADESLIQAAPESSSYLGDRSSYNDRVDTSKLKTTDPPNRSFSQAPPQDSLSSFNQAKTQKPNPTSNIQPAPNTPRTESNAPFSGGNLPPIPPNLTGAAPEPTGFNPGSSIFPNLDPNQLNPDAGQPQRIPPSQQTIIPIISTSVPYQYPASACPSALEGTSTLAYYRQPDGTFVDGSVAFENRSGSPLLDDVALNAVINSTAVGTGTYQRYSSRFEFKHSKEVCSQGTNEPLLPETSGTPLPQTPTSTSETDNSGSSKSKESPTPEQNKKPKNITPDSDVNPEKTPEGENDETLTPAISDPDPQPKTSQPKPPETVIPPTQTTSPPPEAIPPQAAEPLQIQPAEPIPSSPPTTPAEPKNPTTPTPPVGNAADLVPLETVSPSPKPPVESPPTDLKISVPGLENPSN